MTSYNRPPTAPPYEVSNSKNNFSYPPPPPPYQEYPPNYAERSQTQQNFHRNNSYPPRQNYPATYPHSQQQNHPDSYQQTNMPEEYVSPGEDPSSGFNFTEKSIRLNFIRKVYSILTVQLLIVVAFVALFLFERNLFKFFSSSQGFIYVIVAAVVVFVLCIMMACCANVRRTAPMNYICLFLFTFAMSFLVGIASAAYSAQEVMLAMGMTAGITLGLTVFAFQTKYDFTKWGGALFALLIVLVVAGIFLAFFPSRIWQTIIAGFGALLMSFYILYDTQLMLGGSHKYSLSPEEYVFAALNLYLDIINLFLYILQIIGGRGGN